MRRLVHGACPADVQAALQVRATNVANGALVAAEWKSFSNLKAYRTLRTTLAGFLGDRRRCCFCSDSMGAEVEHFWPKEKYPERAFDFNNLLLACGACNRKKLAQFPLDHLSHPLLINPATDDPWDSLYFVTQTGLITPRIVAVQDGRPVTAPKGEGTLAVLGDIVNGDPALLARQRNWSTLVDRLSEYMAGERGEPSTQAELFGDLDDYGLAEWLIAREGKEDPRVRQTLLSDESQWRMLRDLPRL